MTTDLTVSMGILTDESRLHGVTDLPALAGKGIRLAQIFLEAQGRSFV